MVYNPRAIDLDLFVNSASKGFNDGAKVPTPFAAFLQGVTEGIDQNYKNELAAAQTEAIRINNEQAPYETAIKEAQAARAQAETAAIRENPEAFKESIITKAETDRKAIEQQALLQQKESTLVDIIQNGSSEQKAQALMGSEFAGVYANKPEYRTQLERTMPFWEAPQKDMYDKYLQDQLTQKIYRQQAATDTVKDELAFRDKEKAYFGNTGITKIANAFGTTEADILINGKVVPEYISADLEYAKVMENGKPKIIKNELGNETFEYDKSKLVPSSTGDKKWRDVFYYKDQPFYGADPETLKVYSEYKSPWQQKENLKKDQGGVGTLLDESKKVEEQRAVQKVEAEQKAQITNQNYKANQEKFLSGTMAAKKALTPTPTAPKQTILSERTVEPKVANLATKLPITVTPLASKPPTQQADTGDSLTPTPTPSFNPNPQSKAYSIDQQEELLKAKAKASLQKRGTPINDTSGGFQGTPYQQASFAIRPRGIPANISINIADREPDETIVNKIANMPILQNSSALVKAVVAVESAGNPNAVSPTGVTGLMQTTLGTAQDVDPTIKSRKDLLDPRTSLAIGTIRLNSLASTYDKSPILALIGYNAGPGVAADIARRVGVEASWEQIQQAIPLAIKKYYPKNYESKTKETTDYPKKVMSYFSKFIESSDDLNIAETLKEQRVLDYA